ncbi:uncharacterized protein B0I36DRAFT_427332 [Microdochium trichocladiopsis]|uniref:Rho-GAP domain-containing protein n=1 Tax=Microdochium trichocladiopsis TaxID=1682393 RepID=A0A9P9BWQ8_9PEZI|nr:uncharacterized protein B0I36DRAFT_427332 [Microdochium trichocladiopsis]KAH7041037.1 hypothetical protein B0I36DRAFT_427332 [Microdochium trichocladiopsis]
MAQQRQAPISPPQQFATPASNPASPPTKRDLKSWWKRFQSQGRPQDAPVPEARPQGIFGVPLRQSITYANVAISLVDEDGKSYIYGYVPIVVAKCGVFLKEKATGIEGIFRLSGSEKRIKELKLQFDSPDRYGKGLVWDGYTVHDAANVLRRYLNDLPEPVVPLDLYERFRDPLRGSTRQAVGDAEGAQLIDNFNEEAAIARYQQLIKELPPLNRQLLLYILDLLAVFAAKADENRMTAQNLAAIFQPGMLSHPTHAMAPEEYRLNQCVIIFLIENQDHFLIGMQGTGTDEKTKREIEKGVPAQPVSRSVGVHRSASTSSAAAESISRDGMVRRNRSTSSRHSRQSRHSNGTSTPNSPALMSTPSSALGRSNTVPSKKSPHMPPSRFPPRQGDSSIAMTPTSPSPGAAAAAAAPPTVTEEPASPEPQSPTKASTFAAPTSAGLGPSQYQAGRSQEKFLDPSNSEVTTPGKERGIQTLFQRSPGGDLDKRQPNKLRKKRLPGSANPSAHSSTTSLPHSGAPSPTVEAPPPFENLGRDIPRQESTTSTEHTADSTPRASQVPTQATDPQLATSAPGSKQLLKPKESTPGSLHSSFNEGSDIEHGAEEGAVLGSQESHEKDKKRHWPISRRREEGAASNSQSLGVHRHAEMSTSTVGSSGHKPRKSWTGDSNEVAAALADADAANRDKDGSRNPFGWIKSKVKEAKENAEQKRTKSPPGEHGHHHFLPSRGKSIDIKRNPEEHATGTSAPTQTSSTTADHVPPAINTTESSQKEDPHSVPLPMSPPPTQTTHGASNTTA